MCSMSKTAVFNVETHGGPVGHKLHLTTTVKLPC